MGRSQRAPQRERNAWRIIITVEEEGMDTTTGDSLTFSSFSTCRNINVTIQMDVRLKKKTKKNKTNCLSKVLDHLQLSDQFQCLFWRDEHHSPIDIWCFHGGGEEHCHVAPKSPTSVHSG